MATIDGSLNPYKNKVRNARKKLQEIETLENSGNPLDDMQQLKVKGKKKAEKELRDAEASFNSWQDEQVQALQFQAEKNAPKKAETKPAAKQTQQKPQQQQKQASAAQPAAQSGPLGAGQSKPKSQVQEEADKAKAKGEKPNNQQQAGKAEPASKQQQQPPKEQKQTQPKKEAPKAAPAKASEEDIKAARNKLRNAEKKVKAIDELKRKNKSELTAEQAAKISGEKKAMKEYEDAQKALEKLVGSEQ